MFVLPFCTGSFFIGRLSFKKILKNGGLTAGAELTVICLGVQKREAVRPKVEVVQVEEEVVHEDNDWGERHEVTHPVEVALDSN